ncbi:LPS assembly protein LptD [Sphingorhabdus sp. Alg239-R122]|uniref:LPS-assembly protein LptD n=1 Tax=Sphingorhabdus sp. Alg239-R122 TaxID=2305989 RepID=UPI001F07897D|nr:LPS assembly protein LptD [Sphingorhabdus sp. Alg239-R122]
MRSGLNSDGHAVNGLQTGQTGRFVKRGLLGGTAFLAYMLLPATAFAFTAETSSQITPASQAQDSEYPEKEKTPGKNADAKNPNKKNDAEIISEAVKTNQQVTAERVEFLADKLEYDEQTQIVTATGNVILTRATQKVRAGKIVWNRKTGKVEALGNVRVSDANGNVIYGENITLTDDLRDGAIENILVVLDEGGRIAAMSGEREDGFITLNRAVYSPYPIENPDGTPRRPTWQIKAVKVVYDPNKEKLSYRGARMELFGVPLVPLPGLSHSINNRSRSGLLVPNVRFSQANGIEYEQPYYISLAPNRDLTLTGSVYTDVLPMLKAQYRALNETGAYQVTGYATASSRIPVGQSTPLSAERDFRGYFDASGKFQLSPEWDISASLRLASDRTFLRRYDISRDDRLRSTFQAQRIDENSYFSLTGWATQTLRVNDPQGQVPIALPIFDYRRRMDDPLLGGKFEFQLNSLAIGRTNGQDTQRAFGSARWDLRKLTSWGQELTFTAYGRGDIYHSSSNALTPTEIYRGNSGFETRGVASLAVDMRWPFVGEAFGGTQTITPRFQIVATPPTKNLSIPNEDARAVELEDSNLFALNRFPGYDRVEDGLRLVYGVEWQLRRPGMTINAVVGQSYRFNDKETILPDGTGLSNTTSDVVGRTEVRFRDFVKFTHRYRLDKDNLAVRRNEIDATVGTRRTYGTIGYLRLNRDISADIEDLQDREEIRAAGRVQVAKYWSVFGSAVVDLTDAAESNLSQSDGFEPIRTRLGVAYTDEYLDMGVTWRRDFVATGDAEQGNTFLFRISFRNLGF